MKTRRRRHLYLWITLLTMLIMTLPASAAVSLSAKTATVAVGGSTTLKVNGAGKGKITWSSSNKKIASVTNKGVVKGVKAGTAVITAKVSGAGYTCTVRVVKPSISSASQTLDVGGTATLSVKDTGGQKVTWSSSSKKVATVTAGGVVKAVKAGSAKITAKVGKTKLVCKVTVKAAVNNAKLSASTLNVTVGKTAALKVTNAGSNKITWKTSNAKIATVNTSGTVTGKAAGSANITAVVGSKSLVCKVTVKAEVNNAKLSASTLNVTVGKTAALKVTNAGSNKITWKTSNAKIATVNTSGTVTGKAAGSANITAVVGSKSLVCKVTVKAEVNNAALSQASLKMTAGTTFTLKVSNAGSNKTTWKTSSAAVAKVASTGLVTAVKAGSATITAVVGSKSLTCKVTVTAAPSLSLNELTIREKSDYQLKVNNATGTVAWSSSNTAVAKVTSGGLVSGVKAGSAKITAKVSGKSYTCAVTVKAQQTTTTTTTTTQSKTSVGQLVTVNNTTTSGSSAATISYASYSGCYKGLSAGVTDQAQLKVLQRMLKLIDMPETDFIASYKEGATCTNNDYYKWHGGYYRGGYGCAGFTFKLSDVAFYNESTGTWPIAEKFDVSDYRSGAKKIRVGDILRLDYDTHSVIVLRVESDGVIVGEGNYGYKVHWGRKIPFSEFYVTGKYVMTRYNDTPGVSAAAYAQRQLAVARTMENLPDLMDLK